MARAPTPAQSPRRGRRQMLTDDQMPPTQVGSSGAREPVNGARKPQRSRMRRARACCGEAPNNVLHDAAFDRGKARSDDSSRAGAQLRNRPVRQSRNQTSRFPSRNVPNNPTNLITSPSGSKFSRGCETFVCPK